MVTPKLKAPGGLAAMLAGGKAPTGVDVSKPRLGETPNAKTARYLRKMMDDFRPTLEHNRKQDADAFHGKIRLPDWRDAEGKHSPRQLEAYWRWAVVPCFLATLLSILGAVFTQQTTYFLFVAVFPNRYVAAHGQWGDGVWTHNPWAWALLMISYVSLGLALGSYVLIGMATLMKLRAQRADHLGPWDSQRLSSAKPAVFAEGGDDDAALAAADLAVDDLAALDDALLANALLKDAGLDTAARLRVLLRVKGGSAVAEDQVRVE